MKVVIIEDEYLMADDLEEKITTYDSSIHVSAKLTSIKEAINYFCKNPLPDLFFADIQLPDGLSFEIFLTLLNLMFRLFSVRLTTNMLSTLLSRME